jgi:short-subunit dehydrogenase
VQIADRTFVVTGASSGIGQALARALVDAGGRVALVARRADRLTALAEQLGAAALAVPADLTTAEAPEAVHDAAAAAFGRVDGLANVAGRGLSAELLKLDLDTLDEAFELNLVAPLRLIQRLVPPMVEREEGIVVNVSSPTVRMGLPGIAGYAMTKTALDTLSLTLRRELYGTGVHVLSAYPGVTESEFYEHLMGEPDPGVAPPPGRPAQPIASAIVRAIARNRREVWALSPGEARRLRLLRLMSGLMPRALDRGLGRRP